MAVFILAICASPLYPRIGETLDQCRERYGEEIIVAEEFTIFRSGDYVIAVRFYDRVVDFIVYQKPNRAFPDLSERLTYEEIAVLLEANANEREWVDRRVISMDREWLTTDGQLFAVYFTTEPELVIATRDALERDAAAKKEQENEVPSD